MSLSQHLSANQKITLFANLSGEDCNYSCVVKKVKDSLVAIDLPPDLIDSPISELGAIATLKWKKDNKSFSLSTKIVQSKPSFLVILNKNGEIVEGEESGQEKATEPLSEADEYLRDLINEVPQLFSLGPDEVNKLISYVTYKSAKKDFPLFQEGEPGDSMFYIAKGAIDIIKESVDGNPIRLAGFTQDSMIGEMALIDASPRSATAMVTEDAELVILSREKFESLLRENPSIGIKIFKQISTALSQRVRFANGRLADVLDQANKQGITLEEDE